MKRVSSLSLIIMAVTWAALPSVEAALIAEWNFDNGDLVANSGEQSASAGFSITNSSIFAASFPEHGDPGKALKIPGVLSLPLGLTDDRGFIIELSGTGLSGFELNYEAYSEPELGIWSTSYAQTWSWKTDETDWSTDGLVQPGIIDTNGGYRNYSVDFSGVTGLNNASTIYLKNSVGSGVLAEGVRFDNISVTAVPEPSGVATIFFGIILMGAFFKRQLTPRQGSTVCEGAG